MKRIILACLFAFFGVLPLAAQDPSAEYWRGFNSYNSFQLGSFESVNLDNFNLLLHIPIVSYPQRGSLPELSITVRYQPSNWYDKEVILYDGSSYYQWAPISNYISTPWMNSSVENGEGFRNFTYPGYPTYYEYYIAGADGSVHNLGATSGNYIAVDASGWSQNSTGMMDKNGIVYHNPIGGSPRVVDPAGNTITLSTDNATLIDSVGRSVPGPCPNAPPTSCTRNYPGLNGGTYPVTYTFANYNIATTFNDGFSREYSGTATLLQSITLPNGKKWTFSYNNFGDLSAVSTPTGGTVSYTWANADVTGMNDFATYARVLATRAVNANDGTGAKTWTYGQVRPGGSSGTPYLGFTDPDGNITAYTTTIRPDSGSLPIPTTKQYYQFTTSGQAQTLLKTVYTNYTWGSTGFCYGDTGTANFLPQYTTTTLPNGTGTLASKVTFTYDSGATFYDPNSPPGGTNYCLGGTNSYPLVYGSVLQKQETDYGSGAPGSVLRNTLTQYKWQSDSTFLAHGMLAHTASVTSQDGGGTQFAQTTYAYDETGNGSVCSTLPCGNLTSETHWLNTGSSPKTQYVYNSQGMKTKKCDPIDTGCTNPTIYTYDFSGLLLSEIQYPNTGSTTHTEFFNYDLNTGLANWQKDQNNQQTSYTYDSMWRLKTVSYPDTGSDIYSYNDTVSYPNSPSFTFTKKITSTINYSETGVIDGIGRTIQSRTTVPSSTCSGGVVYVDTAYDNEGRKKSVSNPDCTSSTSDDSKTTTYYDGLGRPCLVVPPDGTLPTGNTCPTTSPTNDIFTTYSANTTTVTDQAGKSRKSRTDGLGHLTAVWEDPSGLNYETDYTYDALDNLLSVTQNASRQRSFVYDSLSRLAKATNPESGTICYAPYSAGSCQNQTQTSYDANGNLLTKTDARGITTTYAYDALNRLTLKTYSDSTPAANYAYDAVAPANCTIPGSFSYGVYPKPHRTAMCDAGGNEAWNYDSMGRALIDQRTINSSPSNITKTTTYGYDLDGSVATLNYPSGRTLTYTPNIAAQPASAKDTAFSINYAVGPTTCPNGQAPSPAGTVCYTPQGSVARLVNGSNLTTTSYYNSRLQPCRVAVNAAVTAPTSCTDGTNKGDVMDFAYDFHLGASDNGNVYKVSNNRTNASDRNINYTYDSLNRIYQAYTDGNLWGETYQIDAWGNMHEIDPYSGKPAGESLSQGVNTLNQLTNVCSANCYDLAGNLLNDGSHPYTYDAEEQTSTGAGVTYYYDGDGKRVRKSTGTLYWFGTGSDALDETDASGNLTNEYIFFGGKRIARRDSASNVFYYFADQLGTSRSIVQAGQTTPCYDQDFYPYGREIPHGSEIPAFVNTCPQNYKFTGKERDGESGLDDFGARYFSSQYGRFMTPDWVATPADVPYADFGNPQSLNLYGYVKNNPLSYNDPDGHCDWCNNLMDFVSGMGRGVGASLTYGASPAYNPSPGDSNASRLGQIVGSGLVGAAGELTSDVGKGAIAVGLAGELPSGGTSTLVVAAGAGLAAVGTTAEVGATANIARVISTPMQSSNSQTGSYTNTHESGKTYDGKGDQERSQESGKRIEQETGDKHVATDWKASSNNREAFKDESRRLEGHGGPNPDTNHNKIESPGKKYRQQDGE